MQRPIIDNSLTKTRSIHNTSCNWLGTTDFGRLVPFHIEELDPSVKVVTCRPRIELEMLPLASPTFGKLDLYVHYFFVPTRLLWKAAPNFFERQGPNKNEEPPYITLYDLANYYKNETQYKRGYFKHWTSLGLPPFFAHTDYQTNVAKNQKKLTLLKFRAYQQIWWDFYRDPEVIRDDAKLNYLVDTGGHWSPSGSLTGLAEQRSLMPRNRMIKDCWIANLFAQDGDSPTGMDFAAITDSDDVQSVTTTSKDLRRIEAVTRLAERLSLGGKRAIDAMYAAYGVKPNFLKMEMCQYVGGSKSTVLVSDITSNSDTVSSLPSGDDPQGISGLPLGAKAGIGYSKMSDLNINFQAEEHGYLVGIVSVMPHVHFNQGLDKSWFRNSLEQFFCKPLERTGQVAVAKSEVGMLSYNSAFNYVRTNDDSTFAFTQPYYENKRGYDILAGDFAYYHNANDEDSDGNLTQQLQYMQSMEMYVDYPLSREFNANNLEVNALQFNKIFYYLGGSLFQNTDDHFHLCIDKEVVKDTPYDGYAVPTLETTEDPHKSSSPVGGDSVL